MLRPGGRLLIGNVVPGMQGAAYMEAYMDWWLIYRSARDMHHLAALIPPCSIDASRIFEEEQKHITFLELTKAGGAYREHYQWRPDVASRFPLQMQLS
jgi:extracellular factor (EF) 3-hydroxypalmitic acid methyl ester biosynthesis protein